MYWIHILYPGCIIIKYGQVRFIVKSANYYESYGPFFNFMFCKIPARGWGWPWAGASVSFILFLHFHSLSSFFPVLFISSTISSISFLPFSGRRHKMTHKGWRVVKPKHTHFNDTLTNDILTFEQLGPGAKGTCIYIFIRTSDVRYRRSII